MKTPLAVAAISVGPTASGGAQPWWPTALLVNEERSEVLVFSMSVCCLFEFGPQSSPCVSFARVSEAPDVVRKPLPDAAPCAGPTAHGVADDAVMKGEVLKTQLPGFGGLPRLEAAGGVESSRQTSPCVFRCTCPCVDRSLLL